MKFPLFKKENKIFLGLDIGTATIKALIFKKEKEKNIILGADLKEYYSLGIQEEKKAKAKALKEALLEVITQAERKAKVKKFNSLFFLRPPGNILKEKVIPHSFQRENPKEIISQKEESEIYQKIQKKAQEKVLEEISRQSGILSQDFHSLDFRILEKKIDGYEVEQLAGVSGKDLNFKILFTFLPKNYSKEINEIVKSLNLDNLRLVSTAESLLSAFSGQKITAIFLDIGGKLTQIALMREGKLQGLNSFEMGGESFSERMSQALGVDKAQAEDLKIRYAKRILSEEVRRRVKELLSPAGQSWFNNLKLRLKEITIQTEKILPSTIFLFGGGSQLPEIEEILSQDAWEDLAFLQPPEIKFILPKDLKNIESRENIINTPQYIPPLLLCYINA
jgi:cell division ATPase FtsA